MSNLYPQQENWCCTWCGDTSLSQEIWQVTRLVPQALHTGKMHFLCQGEKLKSLLCIHLHFFCNAELCLLTHYFSVVRKSIVYNDFQTSIGSAITICKNLEMLIFIFFQTDEKQTAAISMSIFKIVVQNLPVSLVKSHQISVKDLIKRFFLI